MSLETRNSLRDNAITAMAKAEHYRKMAREQDWIEDHNDYIRWAEEQEGKVRYIVMRLGNAVEF